MRHDDLPVPAPCGADWHTMDGTAQRRVCASCDRAVHDLSAMTQSDAIETIQKPNVCVRYTVTPTGQIRFSSRRALIGSPTSRSAALPAGDGPPTVDPTDENDVLSWILEMATPSVPPTISAPPAHR